MRRRLTRSAALVLLVVTLGLFRASAVDPISLTTVDTTFGSGGFTTIDIGGPGGPNGDHEDEPYWIAAQPDGKYVVSGKALNPRTGSIDLAVLRYLRSGALDPGFGWGGIVLVDFARARDEGLSVAIQPDGRIVVAGLAGRLNGNSEFGLVRLNPNGSRDTSFGWNGLVMTDFFGLPDQALGVVLLNDGKIVAGGYASRSNGDIDFALARYNPNGSLDTSFGIAGRSTGNFWGKTDAIYKLALQADGKIVGAGVATRPDGTTDFALARFHPNGAPDRGFGLGGFVATDFAGEHDVAYALLPEPGGGIVVGGISHNPQNGSGDLAIAKYRANGTIDTAFATAGTPGKVTVDFFGDFDQALWLERQPDGKILAVGHAKDEARSFNFAVTRFTPDGELDPTFGDGGRLATDFFRGPDGAHAAALLDDGGLIVVGDAFVPATDSDDFTIIKYLVSDPSWIAGVVEALPRSAFDLAARAEEITTMLRQAQGALVSGDAAGALAILQELQPHLQGCPGAPDADAWIVDCDSQLRLRGLVDDVIDRLGSN